jgi:two-component system phosphate regulon sensor histidine kinase PhoR
MSAVPELIKGLLEAVPLPQVLVGSDERVLAKNEGARRLFGDGLLGRHYITVLRQPSLLDCVEHVLRNHTAEQARYLTREAQRDATWNVTIAPVELLDGTGALMTFEDATATEEASQIRRDFVANVSHELRTPLTAMMGFIETLHGAARHDEAARERFLTIMGQEAARMNRLVRDLLSLSRVESEERIRPTLQVEITGLIDAVISALREIAETHGARVHRAVSARPVTLPGDPDQLFQVFTNLLENAIKYGGRDGQITVASTTNERDPVLRAPSVRISVRDRGPGIDPLHIPRLTERFYRVDTHRSRELGGTGLGLAIVKHIVSRHRGRLRIESAPGQGSTFTVILPSEFSGVSPTDRSSETP